MDELVTLGIAAFFLYHLTVWALGNRVVKAIGFLFAAAFVYHILSQDGSITADEWIAVGAIAIGALSLKQKKTGKTGQRK